MNHPYMQKIFGIGAMWASMLRMVMAVTGKGYRRFSLKADGSVAMRRKDKPLYVRKCVRQYQRRYA